MKPKEKRESGQSDLFKARLDQIVDMSHPLAKLAAAIDWGFLERSFGAVYNDGPDSHLVARRPKLAVRRPSSSGPASGLPRRFRQG